MKNVNYMKYRNVSSAANWNKWQNYKN